MSEPAEWYTYDCEFCFTRTLIYFDEKMPNEIYCPNCGNATESVEELNFNE